MAHDYPLEQLSPRAFEQIIVALALKVVGPGIESFGAGSDGGREATYRGPINWSATTDFGVDSWNGYVVFQAKQKMQSDADPQKNASWLREQIKSELDQWQNPDSRRGEFPKYIVFVTNVRLSSTSKTGGIDSLNAYIEQRHRDGLQKLGLRGWKIWHRDQLNGLLTIHDGIRHAFPSMLTAGDVLSRFNSLSTQLPKSDQLRESLIEHAQAALTSERWVNFSEAGGENRDSLENVIIDLPVSQSSGAHGFALKTIVQQGERVLRNSLSYTPSPRHIVLTGAPGNGKSTLSKFIVQAYRSSFISMNLLIPSAKEIAFGTKEAEKRLSLKPPKNLRWPFRVNLAEYADTLGANGDKSLLRWISERITERGTTNFTPSLLQTWLRVWPWILVLDGLDEVTMPEVRLRVLDEIRLFTEQADELDADLLVVVTTRPTGYTERFAPQHFYQLDLGYLEPSKAFEYGTRAIERRLSSDFERQQTVLLNFKKAIRNASAERLLKTPLQVLILTYILEKLGTLPADRYQLFWGYYGTVYDREASKTTSLSTLFSRHRSDITELHERVGLELQIQAETLGEATSKLPLVNLRKMAISRMREVGYESPGEAEEIAEKIVQAATHRLVLLVPEEDETVAFEVRSLQELMAARAIGAGSESESKKRLQITGTSPHWRNTWVFVAGRIFSEGSDYDRDRVVEIVSTVDLQGSFPSWLCPVGPELAADILDDGLAATKPKWQRKFVDVALQTLTGTIPRDVKGMSIGLSAAAEQKTLRAFIRNRLKDALSSSPRSIAVARLIAGQGNLGGATPVDHGPRPDYEAMLSGESLIVGDKTSSLGELLGAVLDDLGAAPEATALVQDSLVELKEIAFTDMGSDGLWLQPLPSPVELSATIRAFENEEAQMIFELLCGTLDPAQWQAPAVLARLLWPTFTRTPIGNNLRATFSFVSP